MAGELAGGAATGAWGLWLDPEDQPVTMLIRRERCERRGRGLERLSPWRASTGASSLWSLKRATPGPPPRLPGRRSPRSRSFSATPITAAPPSCAGRRCSMARPPPSTGRSCPADAARGHCGLSRTGRASFGGVFRRCSCRPRRVASGPGSRTLRRTCSLTVWPDGPSRRSSRSSCCTAPPGADVVCEGWYEAAWFDLMVQRQDEIWFLHLGVSD